MSNSRLSRWMLALPLLLSVPGAPPAAARLYKIETTDDDAVDNGNCTLREAIRAAVSNAAVDACLAGEAEDTIQMAPGTYPFGGQETTGAASVLTIEGTIVDPTDVVVDLGHAGRFLSQSGGTLT